METKKLSAKEVGIIAGAIAAVAVAIFMAMRFIGSDRPQPVGPIPQGVVGGSEKGQAMKAAAEGKAGAPTGESPGDSVQPPAGP